jgi:hypothetical protein
MSAPIPDRPPLWRVMEDAGNDAAAAAVLNFDGFAIAAEIRALRDWIQRHGDLTMKVSTWHQIYDLLTAEADRAERGDG